MAAKRGKSQARRSGGNSNNIPGWAWLVLGALLTMVVVIVAPKYLKSGGDGFFRPQPNPDAQPVPVAEDEAAVAPEGDVPAAKPGKDGKDKAGDANSEEYDFYTLLPGKEVPLSDAEIAATERAEAQREAARQKQAQAATAADADAAKPAPALPEPVDAGDEAVATAPKPAAGPAPSPRKPATTAAAALAPAAAASTAVDDNTRYLLQAGAFQASGQAEELKARIAMLGLGARVESAEIKGNTVYRVRMGPYGTAGDLAEAKRKLSAGGLSAIAVKVK